MTTTVKNVTSTRQVLTRDLTDLDPKVRNQIPVVLVAVLAGLVGYFTGHLTVLEAAGIAGPPLLGLAVAYITTSTHRDLILADLKAGSDFVKAEAPVLDAAFPAAGPIIEDAESLAAAVQAGVVGAQTSAIPVAPPAL